MSTHHGPRCPQLSPETLTVDQRHLYDMIVNSRGAKAPDLMTTDGSLLGPFGPMLLSPHVGRPLSQVGEELRLRSSVRVRAREIAILTVAWRLRSKFEWDVHVRIAIGLGIARTQIEGIKRSDASVWTDEYESITHQFVERVLTEGNVDDRTFYAIQAVLGAEPLVDLVVLIGYYSALALLMRIYGSSETMTDDDPANVIPDFRT